MKKDNGTPRMVEQTRLNAVPKRKAIAEQRTTIAEQQLRMVSMIAGPTLISEEEEQTEEKNVRE